MSGSSNYDPGLVWHFVERLEGLREDLAEEGRQIRGQVATVMKQAREAGLSEPALKMILKERAFRVRIAQMAPDDNRAFQHLAAALAELGEAPSEPKGTTAGPRLVEGAEAAH